MWLIHTHTDRHTDTGDDNTWRPKWPRVKMHAGTSLRILWMTGLCLHKKTVLWRPRLVKIHSEYVCPRCNCKPPSISGRLVTQAGVADTMLHVETTFRYLGDMLCSSRGDDSHHCLGKGSTPDHYLNQIWPLQLTLIYVNREPIHYQDAGLGLNVLRKGWSSFRTFFNI